MPLLAVGSVAYDTIETPTQRRAEQLGGSAVYSCTAAARLADTALVAVVGDDFRASDEDFLRSRRIDTTGLRRMPGRTFRWGGRYSAGCEERTTLFTDLGVFEAFEPQVPPAYRQGPHLFLANIDPTLQTRVLDAVSRPAFVACDTMNYWIERHREALDALLPRVDLLLLNDWEAYLLSGERDPGVACQVVQTRGPRAVVVKLGAQGALVRVGPEQRLLPAWPVTDVVDTTGAGDTFAGGLMGFLVQQPQPTPDVLFRAALAGTVLASFCVEGFGVERLAAASPVDIRQRFDALAGPLNLGPWRERIDGREVTP